MTSGADLLHFTPRAQERIRQLVKSEAGCIGLKLRVVPRGCSGMSYDVQLAYAIGKDEVEVRHADFLVLIERASLFYVIGSTMDYAQKDAFSQMFTFSNPHEVEACACGESVMIQPQQPPVAS